MNRFVVGIGEILWDILPEGKKLGGAPANFAYHVKQFGLDSYVVSAVGLDSLGKEIMHNLDTREVNSLLEVTPYPTGTVLVKLSSDGIPQYQITENVAWDHIPFNKALEYIAKNTQAICFGSLAQRSEESRNTINRFIDTIPAENHPLIVFDVNLRQEYYDKDTLHASLERCNVLKINDEEIVILCRLFGYPDIDLEQACRTLIKEYNLKVVILTCGINGSYLFTPDTTSFLPTPKVEVADTVGAGDSFTAAFIAAMLKGKTIEQAHQLAVETSAYVCTQSGAMPVLPDELRR